MTIKELRKRTGLSQQKFGDLYDIPLRTVQNWEGGVNEPPAYLVKLNGAPKPVYRSTNRNGGVTMPRKFKTEEAKRKNYDYKNNYATEKYKRIKIKLKNSDDTDLIKWIREVETREGISRSGIARIALRNYYKKSTK